MEIARPLLEIRGLHKRFGTMEVLKGVDLALHKGEVVSIIGSSGSGKTTLLRCVNLLEEFQDGDIVLDGETIGYSTTKGRRHRLSDRELSRQRSMTGMVFQSFNLFPHLTAAGNVMLGLRKVRRLGKAEARALAESWLGRVGLAARADHYPSQLSGGQQQRVAIARALAMDPKLVLLDDDPGMHLRDPARLRPSRYPLSIPGLRGHDAGHARPSLDPRRLLHSVCRRDQPERDSCRYPRAVALRGRAYR